MESAVTAWYEIHPNLPEGFLKEMSYPKGCSVFDALHWALKIRGIKNKKMSIWKRKWEPPLFGGEGLVTEVQDMLFDHNFFT